MKRFLTTTGAILIACLSYGGTTHYYASPTGFMTIEHLKEPLNFNAEWFSDVDIHTMSHEEALKYLCFNWLKNGVNMRIFAILAKHWNPTTTKPTVPDTTPGITFSVNESTGVIHRETCRFANPLTNTVISDIDFYVQHLMTNDLDHYRACLLCQPPFKGD